MYNNNLHVFKSLINEGITERYQVLKSPARWEQFFLQTLIKNPTEKPSAPYRDFRDTNSAQNQLYKILESCAYK